MFLLFRECKVHASRRRKKKKSKTTGNGMFLASGRLLNSE
jgi:hypothetical protein